MRNGVRAASWTAAPAAVLLLVIAPGGAGAAPKSVGPNRCVSCHDHDRQQAWYQKDPHAKALDQLEDKKAARYTAAVGQADPYDKKGACVSCHATIFNGDANAGVSCETCHGAGSDYLEPHQQKGSYAKSLTLGLFDTKGNLGAWSKMCVDCHIVTDRRLVGAGHSSGAGFDVGAASRKIVHWAPSYDFGKLSVEGSAAAAKRGGAAPSVPAAPSPRPTAAATIPAPSTVPTAVAQAPTATLPAAPAAPPTAPAAAPTPTPTPTATRTSTPAPTPASAREPLSAPTSAPFGTPPPRPGAEVEIVIEATPIQSATATATATSPATATATPSPTPPASPAPSMRQEPAPSPGAAASGGTPPPTPAPARTKASPASRRPDRAKPRVSRGTAAAPAPSPTLTPTRRPAPQEPPRRAPH